MSWEGSWKEGECKRGVGSPWQRMLGELLSRGRRRAWRSGEVRLGKIGFVWDRCEDEDETRGCEWERERIIRINRRVRMSRCWAKGFGSIWSYLEGLV